MKTKINKPRKSPTKFHSESNCSLLLSEKKCGRVRPERLDFSSYNYLGGSLCSDCFNIDSI